MRSTASARSQDLAQDSQTAYEILSYLTEYSRAQDTLDGIIEWWLLERSVRYQIAKVKDALAALVKDGLVLEHKKQNLPTRYALNWDKAAEIRAILKEVSARANRTARTRTKPEKHC
jgi:hypothetical protein